MEADREKLIDRILKLLAVANSTTFAEEADTARKLAEALMSKHNVDATAEGQPDRAHFCYEEYVPNFKGAKWEFMLAKAVCDLTGCWIIWFGGDPFTKFHFAGLRPDAEACIYIVKKLHEQRMAEWMTYKGSGGSDSFYKFCYGFAQGVQRKVQTITGRMTSVQQAASAARVWYKSKFDVRGGQVQQGRASSQAGLSSGGSASFHRGEMGGARPQRLLH